MIQLKDAPISKIQGPTYLPLDCPELSTEFAVLTQLPICIIFTKSNQERKLALNAAEAGFHYFLPQVIVRTPSRNYASRPLFPGIVFISATTEQENASNSSRLRHEDFERSLGRSTSARAQAAPAWRYPDCPYLSGEEFCHSHSGYFQVLRPRNQKRLVQELGLFASETARSRTLRLAGADELLISDTPVRFRSGPMKDLTGVIETPPKNADPSLTKTRIYVGLMFMNRVVSMEVDRADLEIIQ